MNKTGMELFSLYLKQVNDLSDGENIKKSRKARKFIIKRADLIVIWMLGIGISLITLWAIIQEIATKLRFFNL